MLRQLGLRSAMFVPLRARDGTFGAMAFATAESGRTFDAGDFALAENLADRAALALDNAGLYTRLAKTEAELRRSAEELEAISGRDQRDHGPGSLRHGSCTRTRRRRNGWASPRSRRCSTPHRENILERFELYDEDRNPLDVDRAARGRSR